MKFVFDELELVMRITTSSKSPHGKYKNNKNKYNAKDAMAWFELSLDNTIKLVI
jgi:hypothetical protein